jgi:cytochrome bd ubiquinol oxidase subunit II
MSLPTVVAAMMFVGVIAYAVFAGADFGSGVWDLTAGNPQRGGPMRSLIDDSIGPVWEANHVWLIFVFVYLWTAFPHAFAALCETLFVPLTLAGLGIVLRGSAFAFRKLAPTVAQARLFGAIFATASVLTPFFFGAVAGAVASGRVPLDGTGDRLRSWMTEASLVGGVLAVLTSAFLAAVFLTAEADRQGNVDLVVACRRRALTTGAMTGLAALVGIVPLHDDAPRLFDRLTGVALPVVLLSAAAGLASLILLLRERHKTARIAAVVAVASVVVGWGFAQYPWILVDAARIDDVAGARPTLWALVGVFALAAVTVLPALGYLYWLTQSVLKVPGVGRRSGRSPWRSTHADRAAEQP